MAIVSRKPKMNDFRVASMTRNHPIGYGDAYAGTLAFTISGKGSHLSAIGRRDDDHIFVYHVEKKRPKFTQKKSIVNRHGGIGLVHRTTSTKVRDIEWTVRVFKFPKAIVKSVKQHKRHFDIELGLGR
jgi:hypothetical protein